MDLKQNLVCWKEWAEESPSLRGETNEGQGSEHHNANADARLAIPVWVFVIFWASTFQIAKGREVD